MSGEITLERITTGELASNEEQRRSRAMGKNITPPLKETHTGWSDDELFSAAIESHAFQLFDAEIDSALDALVARWSKHAAPNAQFLRRSFKFPSAKPVNKPK